MDSKTSEATTPDLVDVDPWKSEDLVLRRRNLPHLEVPGATYFVTFRSNVLLPAGARDVVLGEILGCEGTCLELIEAVVMPDHVHCDLQTPPRCEDESRTSVDEGSVSEKYQSAPDATRFALDGRELRSCHPK